MSRSRLGKSLLYAVLIVAATVLLVALDPYLMAAYRSVAPHSRAVDALCNFALHLLAQPVILVGILLYVALIRVERLRRFSILAGTALTQGLLVSFLKKLFSRVRPSDLPHPGAFLGPQWHNEQASFPGGHAAAAFALAAVFSAWHPRGRWAFYIGAALISLTRIQLNRHYFGDSFIGAWLGYWCAQCFLVYLGRPRPAS